MSLRELRSTFDNLAGRIEEEERRLSAAWADIDKEREKLRAAWRELNSAKEHFERTRSGSAAAVSRQLVAAPSFNNNNLYSTTTTSAGGGYESTSATSASGDQQHYATSGRRGRQDGSGQGEEVGLDAPMWITVWPGLHRNGNPHRILVNKGYRLLQPVIEKAAKETTCQPTPNVLYTPDGKPIAQLHQLVHGSDYLILPSGCRYNEETVPTLLLQKLVKSARDELAFSGPMAEDYFSALAPWTFR